MSPFIQQKNLKHMYILSGNILFITFHNLFKSLSITILFPKLREWDYNMENDKNSVSRIESNIDELSRFSFPIGNGVTRLAFSPEETKAIYWAEEKLRDFGYECKEDAFLNLHADDPIEGRRRIIVGTHLDTVKNGGKYDGAVGLISFLEALHLRKETGKKFSFPVDFVIFRAEESTMFKEALLGSKVATGYYDLEKLRDIQFSRDEELVDAMIHFGYLERVPPDAPTPSISLSDILFKHTDEFLARIEKGCWLFDHDKEEYEAYFEIHIEQGKVLETKGLDLGIVTSMRAPLRMIFTFEGLTDHSGATPMNETHYMYRRDALAAASECILAIEEICEEEHQKGVDIVGTVGEISIPYSGINKIPGRCKFSLDLRSNNLKERQKIYARIIEKITDICKRRQVSFLEPEETENSEPLSLTENVKSVELHEKIEKVIKRLGYSYTPMASGAGHDAMQIARSGIPVCMLFVPCKHGISHSPEEEARAEAILKASKVFLSYLTTDS